MSDTADARARRPMRRPFTTWIVGGLLLLAAAMPAWAHRAATGAAGPEGGIVIPNLSHGQMRVIADYRSEIMDLAADQYPTDPTMRRLESFINLQRFACMWGIVPGSVTDEDSPFNECAHAYLAATRALLMHLRAMPGNTAAKRTLVQAIELAMLDKGASLVLCRYSDEPFNTAEVIPPHWGGIPAHVPSSMAFGCTALATMWLAMFALRRNVHVQP